MSNKPKRVKYTCRKGLHTLEVSPGWYEAQGDSWCLYCMIGVNAFSSVGRTFGKAYLNENFAPADDESEEKKTDLDANIDTKEHSKEDVTICVEEIIKILKAAFPNIDADVITMVLDGHKNDISQVESTLADMEDSINVDSNDTKADDTCTIQGDENETTLRNAFKSVINMLKIMYAFDTVVIELVVRQCKGDFDKASLQLQSMSAPNNFVFPTVPQVNFNNANANYGYIHQQNSFQSPNNYTNGYPHDQFQYQCQQYQNSVNSVAHQWERKKIYFGKCIDFNYNKRYGQYGYIRIATDCGHADIWVRFDDINGFDRMTQAEGSQVEFEASPDPKKPGKWKAVRVWKKGKRGHNYRND